MKVLAFSNALLRTGVNVDDVAVCVPALFLFFHGPDDFRHVRQFLVTNVTGAEEPRSVCDPLFLVCSGNNKAGTLLSLGVRCEGKCRWKGERQQQCFENSEPWHI